MTDTDALLNEMKSAASDLGVSISTIGRLVGQGGRFHARLEAGKRVWPQTAESVRAAIADLRRDRSAPKQETQR